MSSFRKVGGKGRIYAIKLTKILWNLVLCCPVSVKDTLNGDKNYLKPRVKWPKNYFVKLDEKITRLIPLNLRNILNCSIKSGQLSDHSTFLIDFGWPNSESFNKLKTVELHTVKSKWGQFQISLKINSFLIRAQFS